MKSFFIVVIGFLGLVQPSFSQSPFVILTGREEKINICKNVSVLEDKGGVIDIGWINTPAIQGKFTQSEKEIINFQRSESWYWIKVEVENQSLNNNWLLEIAEAKIEFIDFYFQNEEGEWKTIRNGYSLPTEQKFKKSYFQIFPLFFRNNNNAVFYLHTKANLNPLPISIVTDQQFEDDKQFKDLASGLFMGLLLFIILNNVLISLITRNGMYLLYGVTVLAYILLVVSTNGYLKLFTDFNLLKALAIGGFSTVIFATFYAKRFLKINNTFIIGKVLNIYLAVSIASSIAIFFISPDQAYVLLQSLSIPFYLIILITASVSIKREGQFAVLYLMAYVCFTIFAFLELVHINTGKPDYVYLIHGEWGILCEVLILNYALNRRFNFEKQQLQIAKELAQQAALSQARENQVLIKEQNTVLEQKVVKRTAELLSSNETLREKQQQIELQAEKLQKLNDEQNKLFTIISHDLKSPLNSLKGILKLAESDSCTESEIKQFLPKISKDLMYTSSLLDNLLGWAKEQMKCQNISPVNFNLKALVEDKVNLFERQAGVKGITIKNGIEGNLKVFADVNMIDLVFRNLISNAIKYCKQNDTIDIQAYKKENIVEVCVADTGIGIVEENIHKLFALESLTTKGTSDETGTGLGLALCKDFVEKNGGKIWVTSTTQKSTRFYFTVPA